MNCKDTAQLLSVYLDGELSAAERDLVQQHLNACPACRKELQELEQTIKLVRQIRPAELREDFLPGIRNRLAAQRSERPAAIRILSMPQVRMALAASAVLCICVYAILVTDKGQPAVEYQYTQPVEEAKEDIAGKPADIPLPAAMPAQITAPVALKAAGTEKAAAKALDKKPESPELRALTRATDAATENAPAAADRKGAAELPATARADYRPDIQPAAESNGRLWVGGKNAGIRRGEPSETVAPASVQPQAMSEPLEETVVNAARESDQVNVLSCTPVPAAGGMVEQEYEITPVLTVAKSPPPAGPAAASRTENLRKREVSFARKITTAGEDRESGESMRLITITGADSNRIAAVIRRFDIAAPESDSCMTGAAAKSMDDSKDQAAASTPAMVRIAASDYNSLIAELRKHGKVKDSEGFGDSSAGPGSGQQGHSITLRIVIVP